MPRIRSLLPALVSFAVVLGMAAVPSAWAAERTFILAPGELLPIVDAFNADLLTYSASLGKKTVAIRRGAVSLAKKGCPSLTVDPHRRLTRVRVLDSPARAALLAGTSRKANALLGDALALMGAAVWTAPASGRTRQPLWIAEPMTPGIAAFTTAGFAAGDQTGALTIVQGGDTAASFRVDVNVANRPADQPFDLVLGITSELPPPRPGRKPKRTECFVLAPVHAADLQALRELLAAASLTNITRNRLQFVLTGAETKLAQGQPARAVRRLKALAVEVAGRTAVEIAPADAEVLLTRTLRVIEAIEL